MQTFKLTVEGSFGKQIWKPLDRDGRETRSWHNELRVTFGGLLKNLVFAESDKPLMNYLFERGAAI